MKPFEEYDLGATLSNQYAEIKKKIEKLSNEEIMANDIDVLTENLYQTFFIEPVVIEEEAFSKRKMKQGKIRRYVDEFFRSPYDPEYVDVDGVKAYFYYPYTGEKKLLNITKRLVNINNKKRQPLVITHPLFSLTGKSL